MEGAPPTLSPSVSAPSHRASSASGQKPSLLPAALLCFCRALGLVLPQPQGLGSEEPPLQRGQQRITRWAERGLTRAVVDSAQGSEEGRGGAVLGQPGRARKASES